MRIIANEPSLVSLLIDPSTLAVASMAEVAGGSTDAFDVTMTSADLS